MKVLVIPDVHLKPHMFRRATELMRQGVADGAVCLMDIPDDWNAVPAAILEEYSDEWQSQVYEFNNAW